MAAPIRNFAWQRRAALWGSFAIGVYCLIADWILQPLHQRGWYQPVLAQLNSLSWIASFPGYLIVSHIRLRETLSPPHRTSTLAWWIIWVLNLVLWAVALRLLLRVIFPVKHDDDDDERNLTITAESDSAAPASADDSSDATIPSPSKISPTRRAFLTTTARLAVATAAVTVGHSMLFETRWFEITRRRHAIRGLHPDLAGLRIVQLTDLHHGPAMSLNYVREVIAATNAL